MQRKWFIIVLFSLMQVSDLYAQSKDINNPRALFSYTHFMLYEEPISTQRLDGFMRFYAAFGDKDYAYNLLINNILANQELAEKKEFIYLKNISTPIPAVRENYSERLYAMMFSMIAWYSKTHDEMPTISLIRLFADFEDELPQNLPDNGFATMTNSCEFVTYHCGVYNTWAMNNKSELPKFVALHEKFYQEWKKENPSGSYKTFCQDMEKWAIINTAYEFVTPSQINTCNDLKSKGALVFQDFESVSNTRMHLTQIFRKLLYRSPRSTELIYLMEKVDSKELSLNDVLYLLLTSSEFKETF